MDWRENAKLTGLWLRVKDHNRAEAVMLGCYGLEAFANRDA